jgi:hypothetical protein
MQPAARQPGKCAPFLSADDADENGVLPQDTDGAMRGDVLLDWRATVIRRLRGFTQIFQSWQVLSDADRRPVTRSRRSSKMRQWSAAPLAHVVRDRIAGSGSRPADSGLFRDSDGRGGRSRAEKSG